MPADASDAYPGDLATPEEIRQLADEYRRAATHLVPLGRRGKPLSRAPCRLLALQAIELHLNAFLVARGRTTSEVRGLQHNLVERARLATGAGLVLRNLTMEHLHDLCTKREFLISRYGPEQAACVSQLNRLTATMDEIAAKTTALMKEAKQPGER